ncbi:hypothetical protein [Paraburkholderia sediminicola]|uniref:hypothetical protein n=1 Tax=Paraburkholderia sediminicola TaxID=458836 RepID=UPI0038BD9E35
MSAPLKPSLDEVRAFLEAHQALIVHCSGSPKGVGPGLARYPADLENVWQGRANGGVSCSVVKPGDSFHPPLRHTTGSVGLVIGLTGSNSLVAVAPQDAGSSVVDGVRVVASEVDITISDLSRSLSERGDHYNEWVLRDFKVIGVFIAEPATTWQEVEMSMPTEGAVNSAALVPQDVDISVAQVASDFKGLPVYTFAGRQIVRWGSGGWSPADHTKIYSRVHEENFKAVERQHVLPIASIARFFREENQFVEVFHLKLKKTFRQGVKWEEFFVRRLWDEGTEKEMKVYEDAFQDLAGRIVAGKDALTHDENDLVSKFWMLISERSRAPHLETAKESLFDSIDPTTLPKRRIDFLEGQSIFLDPVAQMDRLVRGMRIRTGVAQTVRRRANWRIVRAAEGQFLVSDTYYSQDQGRLACVPVSPKIYLVMGAGPVNLDLAEVRELNRSLFAGAKNYVFAQRLTECVVDLSERPG